MNFYNIAGQVTRECSAFLKRLGFKNIASYSINCSTFDINMKDGSTAQIRFNEPGVRGIYWSVEDFKSRAVERDKDKYDESKFEEALDRMIDKHDATMGISWDTIDFYLDEMCLKQIKDEEIFE